MDIENIKTFYTVAQYKSFQKAADILLLTQSGVSKRIQNLENELQHQLFIRTHQSVSLSNYGEEYLPYAKRILKIHNEWLDVINDIKDEAMHIAIPFSMNPFFPDIFYTFSKKNKMPIQIHGANSSEIYEMLIDRTVDLAITSAVFPSPQIDYEVIFKERIVCVASADYKAKYIRDGVISKPPIPFVMCKMHNFKAHPWDEMIESIYSNSLLDIVFTVNFFELAGTLIEKGIGATTLPYTEVVRELESGEFTEIDVPNLILPLRSTYIAVNKQAQENKSVKKFREAILDYCRTLPTNI